MEQGPELEQGQRQGKGQGQGQGWGQGKGMRQGQGEGTGQGQESGPAWWSPSISRAVKRDRLCDNRVCVRFSPGGLYFNINDM